MGAVCYGTMGTVLWYDGYGAMVRWVRCYGTMGTVLWYDRWVWCSGTMGSRLVGVVFGEDRYKLDWTGLGFLTGGVRTAKNCRLLPAIFFG